MPNQSKLTTIQQTTRIVAPLQRVFDLSRSIDLERSLIVSWGGTVLDGRKTGLINRDETVTWRLWQFGLPVRHQSLIAAMESPEQFADWYFQDAMQSGIFERFWHDHYFTATGEGTVLRDEISFTVPWYLLGRIAERGWVRHRLEKLLSTRNTFIRELAESDGWKKFLPE